jgi:hypothetical protein
VLPSFMSGSSFLGCESPKLFADPPSVLHEDWPFSSHLVCCTERQGRVIDFWVAFSEMVIIV